MIKIINTIILGGVVLTLLACEKTEIRETIEERMIPQKVDTVKVADNYFLDDCLRRTATDIGGDRSLQTVNLYLDGDELYVANPGGKSVEVFDAKDMKFLRRIAYSGRTLARDVYAEGEHLFVAAGESREVQIFNKRTGEYLTRLGIGEWYGDVSWAGCVAATERFVFVRDSKETSVRVFDRQTISTQQTNNNTHFALLKTGEHFIGSEVEPQSGSYDMEIIADSLYAFVYAAGTIYSWALDDIENKKDGTLTTESVLENMRIFSVSKPKDDRLLVAMEKEGIMQIAEFSVTDFQKRDFSSPLRQIAVGGVRMPAQPMIAYADEHLFLPNAEKVERWEIHNNPTYVIRPSGN